eukprot:GHRQ01034854.1.p3 GENE.GHRQ01034854.1~~GHRQ01034854.1.p3  ORF type:complete len:131 (+),score=13.08 GHRQ01034854.1:674-1066(+)
MQLQGALMQGSWPTFVALCAHAGTAMYMRQAGYVEGYYGSAALPTCSSDTLLPMTAVSPMTTPVPWSSRMPCPSRAAGCMSTASTCANALLSKCLVNTLQMYEDVLAAATSWACCRLHVHSKHLRSCTQA